MKLSSYVCGKWYEGTSQGVETFNAVTGEAVCHVSSEAVSYTHLTLPTTPYV